MSLTAHDMTVRVCDDDGTSSYCFQCPTCQGSVSKPAAQEVADLLASSGVRIERWRRPAELTEPRGGPPITPDDLLDFHELLQQPGWFDALSEQVRRPTSG